MPNHKYTFQTVSVPGSQADTIGGINDLGELSGSNRIWAGIGPETGSPYPAAFTDTGGTFNYYGADGAPYGQHSVGNAINNRGQTVGSSGHYSLSARGYIYAGGTFTEIDGPQNGYDTTANGINDWGQVVGGLAPNGTVATVPPGPPEAYIWQNGSVTKMFSYPGATSTTATGINDWGQIVGYYSDGTTSAGGVTQPADQGFLYASGTMRTIDVPGAPLTDLMAINNVGEIVGSYFDGTHWHGFIDQGGRMSFVNAPGALIPG